MANPSRKPTFSQYGVEQVCAGCGRHLTASEPLWFVGYPKPAAVYGPCCFDKAAAHPTPMMGKASP